MKIRFRFLAGLLTLLALTTMVVEGLWASTCRAEADMRTGGTAAWVVDSPSGACPAETAQAPMSPDGNIPEAPHCPGMPLGVASSCVGVAALPVASLPQFEPSPERSLSLGSADQTRDLLFASAFFRPPIA